MISLKAKVLSVGKIIVLIREVGKLTKCMVLEFSSGPMGKFFQESMKETKKMGKDS